MDQSIHWQPLLNPSQGPGTENPDPRRNQPYSGSASASAPVTPSTVQAFCDGKYMMETQPSGRVESAPTPATLRETSRARSRIQVHDKDFGAPLRDPPLRNDRPAALIMPDTPLSQSYAGFIGRSPPALAKKLSLPSVSKSHFSDSEFWSFNSCRQQVHSRFAIDLCGTAYY